MRKPTCICTLRLNNLHFEACKVKRRLIFSNLSIVSVVSGQIFTTLVEQNLTFIEKAMIDNLNTDDDVVGVKQMLLAVVAIVAILSLWSYLTTVHI